MDSISRRHLKIIEAAADIIENPDDVELAFMARQFVQCTLPHSNPGDVPVWVRDNGAYSLVIQPQYDAKQRKSVGLPYGTIPRLVLFFIITEALRTGGRHVHLGGSFNEFCRNVGLDPSRGGKRSDKKRLDDQTRRLIRSNFSFQISEGNAIKGAEAFINMQIADRGALWWDRSNPDQGSLFESVIELAEPFFNAIQEAPVPADMRALRALKGSSLALDLYMWTAHKTFIQTRRNKSQFVSWQALEKQLGSNYKRTRAFRAKALQALREVYTVSPGLNIEDVENAEGGGLIVHPGKTPVLSKPKK